MMIVPFGLLTLNLGAAIVVHARFRADTWLLVFHLALLCLVVLFVVARLTYFEGQGVVTRGTWFDGRMERVAAGPLHGDGYQRLRFANAGFVERSAVGPYSGSLINQVEWLDPALGGVPRTRQIADDRPLILDGYRIYPANLSGFSPMMIWLPDSGTEERGTVQLPPPGMGDFNRGASWVLASGTEVWAMVNSKVGPPQQDRANLDAEKIPHTLVVRIGDARLELKPGESGRLPGGVLTYVGLDSWLGYHIIHDPTRPWLVATVLVAICSLIAYYLKRLRPFGTTVSS
jgi:cytochrome c biogenesis protein